MVGVQIDKMKHSIVSKKYELLNSVCVLLISLLKANIKRI